MPSELTVEDDGFAKVTLGGVTVQIDLYRVSNELSHLDATVREEFPDEKDAAAQQMAYTDRLREYLAGLGFTNPVSDRAADKFELAVRTAVIDLGKADAVGPTPGSPGSTAPTS